MNSMNRTLGLLMLVCLAFTGTGCKKSAMPASDKSRFDRQVNELVSDILESSQYKLLDIAPVAVVSQGALDGKPVSRLEEVVVQRLSRRLSGQREVITLSRDNWFELRESRPLSMRGHPPDRRIAVEHMVLFVVSVKNDPVFKRIRVGITARDARSRMIPGVAAGMTFEDEPDEPAAVLLKHPAQDSQVPRGLKENPFRSLEQLSYNMATALSDALARSGAKHSDNGFRVVLAGSGRGEPLFRQALIQELQQALVSAGGMTVTVNRTDFGTVASQADFYQRQPDWFETDHEPFSTGSVLLMASVARDTTDGSRKVALRAVWRVSPLLDRQGGLMLDTVAGNYVPDFTSQAWFKGLVAAPGTVHVDAAGTAGVVRGLGDKGFD